MASKMARESAQSETSTMREADESDFTGDSRGLSAFEDAAADKVVAKEPVEFRGRLQIG